LPKESAAIFMLGFLRRDYAAAGFKKMFDENLLDPIGAVVAMVAITLFIPCVANFLIIIKERGIKTTLIITAAVLSISVVTAGILNFVLRGIGIWP
jgi:ferrous iron transport protein B